MASEDSDTDGPVGPLHGTRVIDLTQALAGPYATMVLADLGADVIKVEPPSGDGTRGNIPHLEEDEAYGGYFHTVNRNKRSVGLDLKSDEGRETFEAMVEDADVVIENFRVGTMERLDINYERLKEIKPDLVYASIRGFGDPRTGESPYAERPAFDMIAQAMGGIMSITGTEEGGPTKVGPGVGDIFPGVLATVGVLSALQHRNRTGEGQYVDVSMVDGILALTERIVYQHSFTGDVPGPQGNTHPLLFPFDRFEASDGYVVIASPGNKHWEALCEHIGHPEFVDEYPTGSDRVEHADELRPKINEWTKQHTKDELFDRLADDLPCAPVYDAEDIFEDDHFDAREMVVEVEHADTGETVHLAGSPIKFTETESGIRRKGPFFGEHTRDVLEEVGFTDDHIDELLDSEAAFAAEHDDESD